MDLRTYIMPFYFIAALVTGFASTPRKTAVNRQSAAVIEKSFGLQSQTAEKSKIGISLTNVNFDACAIITKSEIKAVQGEEVKDTRSVSRTNGSLLVSQCFYQLPTYSKSVSLEVTQTDSNQSEKSNLRDLWKEKFHVRAERESERDADGDREVKEKENAGGDKSNRPTAIPKLGDEAFLLGNRAAAVLYILKKNTIIRLSIGGAEDQTAKEKKLNLLARKALSRL